jgi:hypothetical protein
MKLQKGKNSCHFIHMDTAQNGYTRAIVVCAVTKSTRDDLAIFIPNGKYPICRALGQKRFGEQLQMIFD